MTESASGVLAEALRLQAQAAAEGFDWSGLEDVWAKLDEEVSELRAAEGASERAEELGDLLFMVVNLARHMKVDPGAALSAANLKFGRRYGYIMDHADSLPPLGTPSRLDAMETLWQQAKALEKNPGCKRPPA